jgi:hypothetical protein
MYCCNESRVGSIRLQRSQWSVSVKDGTWSSHVKLVQDLLYLGFSTWPPEGCVFDLSLLPPRLPALEALKAYDTFEPGEWDDMFEALAEHGENNMVRRWGPGLVDACTAYYKKFGKNHYTADLDLTG